jgi:hypothetical protein
MTEQECVLEPIKSKNVISGADQHILSITGEQFLSKPVYYRHNETRAEYCYLAGGIGWPRDPKEKPGFAVIVAVDKTSGDRPAMRVLEEAEAPTVEGLLKECVRLQKKYGYSECSDLFRFWYGDPERSDTFVNLFNYREDASKDPDSVYIVAPYDFDRPNAFERYTNQIWSGLATDPVSNRKRLYLGDCVKLRNYIQNTPTDAATKGNVKDYPAIVALGGVVHSLMMLMPWLEFARPERVTPTMHDPVSDLQEAQECALWEEENGIYGYGEMDEYDDDGALVSTI